MLSFQLFYIWQAFLVAKGWLKLIKLFFAFRFLWFSISLYSSPWCNVFYSQMLSLYICCYWIWRCWISMFGWVFDWRNHSQTANWQLHKSQSAACMTPRVLQIHLFLSCLTTWLISNNILVYIYAGWSRSFWEDWDGKDQEQGN